jgi:hypothetical protein
MGEDEIRSAQAAVTAQVKAAQTAIKLAKAIAERYNLPFSFEVSGEEPSNPDAEDWYSSSADC